MSDFTTTQWTMIFEAGVMDPARKAAALDSLCRSYWKPLFGFAKGVCGHHEDAEDLTQGFFEHLLAKELPAELAPENGRFRSWLLTVMKHYLATRYRHDTRLKRGGKRLLKVGMEEALSLPDPAGTAAAYEREWARTVLENALNHLRDECGSAGQSRRFEILGGCLFDQEKGEGATPEQAAELGVSHNAAKITLSRMRQRYRELLRKEVASLVGDAADVDDEIAHLVRVLRGM